MRPGAVIKLHCPMVVPLRKSIVNMVGKNIMVSLFRILRDFEARINLLSTVDSLRWRNSSKIYGFRSRRIK